MLINSQQYLNTVWTSNGVPEYNSTIINRFPIFKEAQSDISIKDFNHFFGPGGTMESFFNQYLEPFVDTSQVYLLDMEKLDGEGIPIAQPKLDMLTQASMIQKMFYTDNSHALTLNVTLTPMDLSSNVSRFILNIGGKC